MRLLLLQDLWKMRFSVFTCSLSGACLPRRGRSRINWPQVFFFSWFCFQSCCGRNKEGWFGTWHEATLEKDERAFFMTNDVAGSVSSHTRSAVWRSDNKPLLCFDLLASFHIGAILYDCNAGTIRTFVKREQAVDLLFQRINRRGCSIWTFFLYSTWINVSRLINWRWPKNPILSANASRGKQSIGHLLSEQK